eukprot:COSAG02_NODE_2159_length_9628_cov_7.080596_8_plen_142_part_00
MASAGDAGDVIATRPPRLYTVGTGPSPPRLFPAWMSGWDARQGHPHMNDETEGRLPHTVDGVKPVTMCLHNLGGTCGNDWQAAVVNCGEYFLWKLPMVPTCPAFYTTQPSGLPRAVSHRSIHGTARQRLTDRARSGRPSLR